MTAASPHRRQMTTSGWPDSTPRCAEDVVDGLFRIYQTAGHNFYDESVTQLEHALQCAVLAAADSASDHLVAAALLHDIGHVLVDEHHARHDFLATDSHHERVGASLLARWFRPTVTGPVALHVLAKRYLVATDPEYLAGLSAASRRSLELQGGPLQEGSAAAFARGPYAHDACRLRRWDDHAKRRDAATPALEHFRPLLLSLIRR